MISVLRSALPSSRFLLSSQKNYNLQPFHNKAWLIHFHVTCATRIMLATLTSSLMQYQTQELIDWETPFGGPWELMSSK